MLMSKRRKRSTMKKKQVTKNTVKRPRVAKKPPRKKTTAKRLKWRSGRQRTAFRTSPLKTVSSLVERTP